MGATPFRGEMHMLTGLNSTTQNTFHLKYEKSVFHLIINAGYPLVVKGLNAPLEIG